MNGNAKRLLAIFAILAMIVSASAVILIDEQDSSADLNVYSDHYFKDQLETKFARDVYDKVAAVDDWDDISAITIPVTDASDRSKMEADDQFTGKEINKGIIAAIYDNPLRGFYIHSTQPAVSISHTGGYSDVTFSINKVPTYSESYSTYTTEMSDVLNGITQSTVVDIHSYVVDQLTYNSAGDVSGIRSVYTALCGDKNVVCEGYAKLFKVICDKKSIPCIIVTGKAGTGSDPKENHMWNYVQLDGRWYLVDCTWDDQSGGMETNYLLAGTDTDGFNSTKVGASHDPSGLDTGFSFPALSAFKYGEGGTQYLVTFKTDDSTVYRELYCAEGSKVAAPATDPEGEVGSHFLGWYNESLESEFDFDSTISSDTVIKAKWTMYRVFTLKYDTGEGSPIQPTREETSDHEHQETSPSKVMHVTKAIPYKEGSKFKGWNTSPDGNGVSFEADDEIVLVNDEYTLYAVWEDTTSVTYKINSLMDEASAFLSEETVPGVSNMLLTIGVITGVVSLLAIIVIARK